jgi:predicted permease
MLADFRFALRSLRRSPAFTAVALIVLTLGIGATTAIYSIVDAVALKGMPFERANELMIVEETTPSSSVVGGGYVAAPNFFDFRTQQTSFEDLAAVQSASLPVYAAEKEPESLRAAMVSASLMPMLRVRPIRGQLFTAANEVRGENRVALISTRLWQGRFGSDPEIVGKTFTVGDAAAAVEGRGNNGAWRVVGVMPEGFEFPVGRLLPVDVWIPYVPPADEYPRGTGNNRNYNAQVIGRLKPGVSLEQAYAKMAQITGNLKNLYPLWFRDERWVRVVPLHESVVGRARGWMFLLLGSVAFVLLIACVNVANLMLARASSKARDVGVRAALGASRWQLARVLLAESLTLSALGTLFGLAVAYGGIGVLRSSLPGTVPRLADASLNLRVLAMAALAAVGTGVFFGLLPALRFSRPRLASTLREGGRSGEAGQARERARSVLLVAEVALAVMLLIGAGSSSRVSSSSCVSILGTNIDNILTMRVSPRVDFAKDRIDADRARGGRAGRGSLSPRQRAARHRPCRDDAERQRPARRRIQPNRLRSPRPSALRQAGGHRRHQVGLGQLLQRDGHLADQGPASLLTPTGSDGAEQVLIINDIAEQRYFNGRDALGQTVKVNGDRTIIGVVRAVRVSGPER